MEGAGAARAVKEYDRDVALLVLRGISDFADGRKAALNAVVSGQTAGVWRRYAAENAIELLFAFLAAPGFPWRTPVPLTADEEDVTAPAVSVADLPPPRSHGAWDYFMRAAQVVEATAAGVEIVRALRPGIFTAGGGHHGNDADNDGDQGHRHRHHGVSHGHHDAGHEHETTHDPLHDSAHPSGERHDSAPYMDHGAAVEPELHIHTHLHLTDPHHFDDPHHYDDPNR